MTKSELISALADRQKHLAFADVELAVRNVIEQMSVALASGDRIEIRGFGSFSLHYRPPRTGREDEPCVGMLKRPNHFNCAAGSGDPADIADRFILALGRAGEC